ncbi:hypothetical protein CDN99_20610 [Roseateles aquatilis]|uniref:Nucleoside diphosphate kinase-like domain-containing protein n=1 Tax=Roseateles aquatilis TaxID=431061 RepID=A0A246J0V9_9BURK|nr:nucleoside-diphosphate kinase [Roseateles aquatilis]OWQ86240.1 hypothetical protein CDN99_20610 [Roseateles aquatilis]
MRIDVPPPEAIGPTEPAIAMLKPDAFERGLDGAILDRLRADGFVEQARRDVHLTPADVEALFLHPTPAYVAHLTSRPVSMHLLRGVGGAPRLYDCKQAIRRRFGTPEKIRNLIHGTDEGTEYHLFLARFFPDLAPERHCGPADLDLRFAPGTSLAQARAELARLDASSDLHWVSVTLLPGQAGLLGLQGLRWERLRVGFAARHGRRDGAHRFALLLHAHAGEDLAPLLAPGAGDDAGLTGGRPVTLAELPMPADQLARYARDLRAPDVDIDRAVSAYPLMALVAAQRALGVDGLNVFAPAQRLLETELLADLGRVAGLRLSGGSAGRVPGGGFSVSRAGVDGLPLRGDRAGAGSPASVPF